MHRAHIKWNRPDQDWIKINTDSVVDSLANVGGVGLVARDHEGSFVFGKCMRYEGITEPESIELLACRDVVVAAAEKGNEPSDYRYRLSKHQDAVGFD